MSLADAASSGSAIVNRDLLPRIASSVVLIAIATAAAWAGGLVAACVLAAISAIVHHEWTGVTEAGSSAALPFTGAIVVAMIAYGVGFPGVAVGVGVVTVMPAGMSLLTGWE